MSECLKAAIIAGVVGVIGQCVGVISIYLTYKLAMATLQKEHKEP